MASVFTIVLLAWPVVEIAAFVWVARWLGILGALAAIILSSLVGFALLRRQGLTMAENARRQMAQGEMPVGTLFDGACLAVAALLLILPGFVSDLVAVALLLPPVRAMLRTGLAKRLHPAARPEGPTVIEGEYREVHEVAPEKTIESRRPEGEK